MSSFPPVYNNVSTTLRTTHLPGDGKISVAIGAGASFGSSPVAETKCPVSHVQQHQERRPNVHIDPKDTGPRLGAR